MKKRLLSIALSIMIAVTFMPVTANAAFALTAVTGLKATAQTSSVKLTWEKVSGAKKYQVYRATSDDGKYSKLGTTGKTYYTNSSLAKGKKYFYKVRAYRYVDGKLEKGRFCASVQ